MVAAELVVLLLLLPLLPATALVFRKLIACKPCKGFCCFDVCWRFVCLSCTIVFDEFAVIAAADAVAVVIVFGAVAVVVTEFEPITVIATAFTGVAVTTCCCDCSWVASWFCSWSCSGWCSCCWGS
uniref:Putative casein kinase i isoform gamma-2 n=1 Tax=Anopheles darlingi TaxID=43151 RepID=A0A2M4DJ60_ANODA